MTAKNSIRAFWAWLLAWSTMVYAYAAGVPALSVEMRNYDWASVLWAAGFATAAGVGSTVVSLMSQKIFVFGFWRTLARNVVLAFFGGTVVYVIFLWLQTVHPFFNQELRLVVIFVTGASNGRWKDTLGDLVTDAVSNARQRVRGAPLPKPPDVPPPSATMPLDK